MGDIMLADASAEPIYIGGGVSHNDSRPPARRVLVVDDEPDMRDLIGTSLRLQGWEPLEAASQAEALSMLAAAAPVAVVLDVNLAGESGYEICRAIRQISSVPILFLTARSDEFDQILGLELGADDFLTKPFSPRVLGARVAAAVRRGAETTRPADGLSHGSIALDLRSRRVTCEGRALAVAKTEFDLLRVLLSEPGRAFDRATLIDRVWGRWFSDDHVLDVTIGRLRRRFAALGVADPIETIRGVGYRLRD